MRVLSILSGVMCVVGMTCMAFVLGYMYHSYKWATLSLEACQADGVAECHLERDGLEFNVYGEE